MKRVQILIVVDLDAIVAPEELAQLLPHERDERKVYVLTEWGAPRLQRSGPQRESVDWERIGRAVEDVVQDARAFKADNVLDLYVGGQGPLPVFTHLGYAFSKFTGSQSVVGRLYGGPWQSLPISATPETLNTTYLSQRSGFRAQAAATTGTIAVYVDTAGRPAPVDAIRASLHHGGGHLGEVVELRSAEVFSVVPENSAGLAHEIAQELPRIPSMYPHAEGSSVFVAGPTALAFMVGRSLNPTLERGVSLTNFSPVGYEYVYDLPFIDRIQRQLSGEPEDLAARAKVRDTLVAAVTALQKEVSETDLPSSVSGDARSKFLERLRHLKPEEKQSSEFELSVSTGSYSLGDGLLEALRNADTEKQGDFAKLLLLHELYHDVQGIRSTNYFDIGRAGVVLEHVDFAADVFAVQVAVAIDLRGVEPGANEQAKGIAKRWMEAVIFGIERFDLHQHGDRIARLPERRLRRYLTWYLQLARAETVSRLDDVRDLLCCVLTAELAPLASRVDHRYDKEVLDGLPMTEFFAAVDGHLIRSGPRPGFDPASMVEAVRSFNRAAISKATHFLVEEFRHVLAPWRP